MAPWIMLQLPCQTRGWIEMILEFEYVLRMAYDAYRVLGHS